MKKRVKEKWLEALRSGKYKKGTDYLKTQDGKFCCLGVLCDLYAIEKGVDNPWKDGEDWQIEEGSKNFMLGQEFILPLKVQEWAGLSDSNPKVMHKTSFDIEREYGLDTLNDDKKFRMGFKRISDVIEARL